MRRVALAGGVLLQVGCGTAFSGPVASAAPACTPAEAAVCARRAPETLVQVIDPLLEERIRYLAGRSTSFRDAWDMIRASGVPVTIGTAAQLHGEIPSSFRKNPSGWAGVTVVRSSASGRGLARAFVALQVPLIERMAGSLPVNGRTYLVGEVDRLLIHEIYGHLAPMVAVHGPARECPDVVRPGEARPCVEVREEHVARELAAAAAGSRSPP